MSGRHNVVLVAGVCLTLVASTALPLGSGSRDGVAPVWYTSADD